MAIGQESREMAIGQESRDRRTGQCAACRGVCYFRSKFCRACSGKRRRTSKTLCGCGGRKSRLAVRCASCARSLPRLRPESETVPCDGCRAPILWSKLSSEQRERVRTGESLHCSQACVRESHYLAQGGGTYRLYDCILCGVQMVEKNLSPQQRQDTRLGRVLRCAACAAKPGPRMWRTLLTNTER